MLKIVVFDGGWGGELVAKYLAEELHTVEIERVIDWEHAPYDNKTPSEIERLSGRRLCSYVGKVDLIVLGGYAVSLALDYLERRFPEQKFIGMGINYYRVLKTRNYPSKVAIFVDSMLIGTDFCQEIRQNLPYSTIIAPDCSGWEELINLGEMSKEVLHSELHNYFQVCLPEVKLLPAKSESARGRPRREAAAQNNISLLEQISRQKSSTEPESQQAVAKAEPSIEPLPAPSSVSQSAPSAKPVEPGAYPPEKRILPDAILLLNTHFWEIRADLEELFGFRVRVLDFRQKLLHDTCIALSLRGVDGCRSK